MLLLEDYYMPSQIKAKQTQVCECSNKYVPQRKSDRTRLESRLCHSELVSRVNDMDDNARLQATLWDQDAITRTWDRVGTQATILQLCHLSTE